jgi:hypothetical protein
MSAKLEFAFMRLASRFEAVYYVNPWTMLVVIPSAVCSIVLGAVTGHVYSHFDGSVSPFKVSTTLYLSAAAHFVLALALFLRGTMREWNVFKSVFSQVLHTALGVTPTLLVTALWAARSMIDATVLAGVNYDKALIANPNVLASYQLLTATMVFSNIYTACTLSVLYGNTFRFIDAEYKSENDRV